MPKNKPDKDNRGGDSEEEESLIPSDLDSNVSAYLSDLTDLDSSFSNWFILWLYILASISGLLVGYQQGIIAGLELYLKDEYEGIST